LLLALPAEIRCGHRAIGVFPVRPFFDRPFFDPAAVQDGHVARSYNLGDSEFH
jgi:hypothetical protein